MIKLLMPPHSFETKEEVKQIPVIISKLSDLMEQVDDDVEIWVIGNSTRDREFWVRRVDSLFKKRLVLNPYDNRPVNPHRILTHLATVVVKLGDEKEYIYGNTEDTLFEFVRAVILRAIQMYPRIQAMKALGWSS